MSKKVEIDGKTYILKEVDEVETKEEEEAPVETEDTTEEEVKETDVEEAIDAATEKIYAKLGLDKINEKMDKILSAQTPAVKKEDDGKKALINLENLMKKDVSEMTSREKIVGFFQAMLQNNDAVMKALSEGTPADGGYLFPDEFRSEIIRDLVESPRMRNEVTIIPMRRDVMNIPTLASRPQVTWTDENATKSTTTAHFGQVTLTVKKMAAILYASDELIDDSTEVDIVNFIIGLFSEAIGEEEDRVIWRGNGTTEPTGIVGSAVATRNCSGNLSVTNMIDLLYDLPQKYHANAKFYVHRTNIRELRKLTDSNGRFYWAEPVAQGLAPTFMGYPVVEANELPEANIYFGDLKKAYWLGDRQKMTVKVSNDTETAFTKDQTAIRVVSRIAGNVVLAQAARGLVAIP